MMFKIPQTFPIRLMDGPACPLKYPILALSDNAMIFSQKLDPASTQVADLNAPIRYQFNPHLSREETITAILVKTLTVFPSPDFSLCLHLLPPATFAIPTRNGPDPSTLAESVQKLTVLNNLLSRADYATFWGTLRSDDLYADLVAEVVGFEELMRVRIAATVSQAMREVEKAILEDWLDLRGEAFNKFVGDVCGWKVERSGMVNVPPNKENEAKGTVVRENVKFDRESLNPLCY